jgi:quercetin dioxygenase-like cupin family protein
MDEAFYVLEGSGVFSLNDASYPIEKVATIFIPKNAWHGFTTPEHQLLLLWVMAPPGIDGFFRETNKSLWIAVSCPALEPPRL